jgi:hypothetical protein
MGKKTPKTPDPVATATAQAGQNTLAANANTIASSGSVTNPYGTQSSQIEYMDVLNPLSGKMEKVARNNVTQTLSAGQQGIFDANQQSEKNLADYGGQQTAQLLERGGTPFSYDVGEHEAWAGNKYNQLNAETNAANDEALRSRLSNQGIKMGSAAYDREMANAERGRGNARNQFMLDAQQQGYQQALATRNQQTNEPLAIASGTQIQMPNFQQGRNGNIATTDYAGIQNAATQNEWAKYNSKQSNAGGLLGGIAGLFGGADKPWILSDERAKTDIEKVGKINGHNVHKYRYKDGGGIHLGLMAQEVEKKTPKAVRTGSDGMKRVNYGIALGV